MHLQNDVHECARGASRPRAKALRSRTFLACALAIACAGVGAMPGAFAAAPFPGARVDRPGEALHLIDAVRQGRMDAVRRQVAAGAAIDACAPGDGTALIVAAQRGDAAMLEALLGLGADANRPCAGDGNPLIAAAGGGNVDAMARLLGAGAQVDDIVRGDETALITAARKGRLAAVQFLAAHGADVNLGATADNGQWRTPLNQARGEAIADFLRGRGATRNGVRRP